MPQMRTLSKANTRVTVDNGRTSVQLHKTTILVFNEKTITLNTGGWYTTTTRNRMNQASNQFNLGYYANFAGGEFSVMYNGQKYKSDHSGIITFSR